MAWYNPLLIKQLPLSGQAGLDFRLRIFSGSGSGLAVVGRYLVGGQNRSCLASLGIPVKLPQMFFLVDGTSRRSECII